MKVGFFCNEYPPRVHGGIGSFVQAMASALSNRGHSVTIVEFGDRYNKRADDSAVVITLPECRVRHISWIVNRWRLSQWVGRTARLGQLDLFECPEHQGWLLFSTRPCPVVLRLHHAESHIRALMGESWVHPASFWLEWLTLFRHRNWIGVSEYIMRETQNFFSLRPKEAKVIHNPAPPVLLASEAVSEPSDLPYVLFLGTLSTGKGVLRLAQAFGDLLRRVPNVRLVYVGRETTHEGAPISKAIASIVGKDIGSRVLIVGALPREIAMLWLRNAVALVLPSCVESSSLVALEAMQLGVPVILSRSGPAQELITHNVDGLLVDPDDIAGLTRAIELLVTNSEVASRLAMAGKQTVSERFSVDGCVRATLSFYERVIASTQESKNRNQS